MRLLHHLGGGGDKQTFLIGCLATASDCHVVTQPVSSAARIMDGAFCGRAMVQVRVVVIVVVAIAVFASAHVVLNTLCVCVCVRTHVMWRSAVLIGAAGW